MVQEMQQISPINMRIMFEKTGKMQYISHLDLVRTFKEAIIRAQIPIWYSKGFNPHPKMVFSLPLSIGVESKCEFLDIKLDKYMSGEEIKKRLSSQFVSGFEIVDVYEPTTKFSDIYYAEYDIVIGADLKADDVRGLFVGKDSLIVTKKTKSGEREMNVIELMKNLSVEEKDGEIRINGCFSAKSESYLNPLVIVQIIEREFNVDLLSSDNYYSVMRKEVYGCQDKVKFR